MGNCRSDFDEYKVLGYRTTPRGIFVVLGNFFERKDIIVFNNTNWDMSLFIPVFDLISNGIVKISKNSLPLYSNFLCDNESSLSKKVDFLMDKFSNDFDLNEDTIANVVRIFRDSSCVTKSQYKNDIYTSYV